MASIRIKICCMATLAEAKLAIRHGAAAVGLVAEMPTGPGPIPEETIVRIAAAVPPSIQTFLLTSLQSVPDIIAQQRRCRTSTLQLCDRLEPGALAELKAALPQVAIVQVVHVRGEEAIARAEQAAPYVDGVLLDSGNPDAPAKELGGTGRTHDWQISARIRRAVQVPVYLAGGLRPDNVAAAIRAVGPFAVDVCSGVRTGGKLDERKLKAFVQGVRSASDGG